MSGKNVRRCGWMSSRTGAYQRVPTRAKRQNVLLPTTASESSTDKDTIKHSMESDDKPKKHSVDGMTGKGSYLCRCQAEDREQDNTAAMP